MIVEEETIIIETNVNFGSRSDHRNIVYRDWVGVWIVVDGQSTYESDMSGEWRLTREGEEDDS